MRVAWETAGRFPTRRLTVERASPADEDVVHRGGADDRLTGHRQRHRMQDERLGLRAAEPAVERDQLLERAALLEVGVVEAVDHDVGDVLESVGAAQMGRRARARTAPAGPRRRPRRRPGSECRAGRGRPVRARASGRAGSRYADACAAPRAAAGGARRSPPARAGGVRPSGRSARGCPTRARSRRDRRRRHRSSVSVRPVASATACPTAASFSSPVDRRATFPSVIERSTNSFRS